MLSHGVDDLSDHFVHLFTNLLKVILNFLDAFLHLSPSLLLMFLDLVTNELKSFLHLFSLGGLLGLVILDGLL